MKDSDHVYPPVTPFERQTGCCPLLMATLILDQLKNYFWTELPEDLADEVAQKAEIVFAGNARWRQKFKGWRGRDYLVIFMRHWFASALFKRRSPLFRQLPEEFKIGKPLPDISYPRQLQATILENKPQKTRNAGSPQTFRSRLRTTAGLKRQQLSAAKAAGNRHLYSNIRAIRSSRTDIL